VGAERTTVGGAGHRTRRRKKDSAGKLVEAQKSLARTASSRPNQRGDAETKPGSRSPPMKMGLSSVGCNVSVRANMSGPLDSPIKRLRTFERCGDLLVVPLYC
jgi:hypothetical protein